MARPYVSEQLKKMMADTFSGRNFSHRLFRMADEGRERGEKRGYWGFGEGKCVLEKDLKRGNTGCSGWLARGERGEMCVNERLKKR